MSGRTVRLADVTTRIGSGITPRGGSTVYKTVGRPFVRSQNVGWGNLRLEDLAYIDEATHMTFPATEIRTGDILLNITGASIGRSAVATSELDGGNVNQHVCEIRLKQRLLDPHYVNAFLLSRAGQDQINMFQAGGNRQGLNFHQVGSIAVPDLDIGQQRAIGVTSRDADGLIAALERMITKKQAIKQGTMQELLTGRVRLLGFESSWSSVVLGSVGRTYGGLTGKSADDFGCGNGRYVVFMDVMANIRIDGTRLAKVRVSSKEHQNTVRNGDLLLNGSSETPDELAMAAVAVGVPSGTMLNSFCFGFRLVDGAGVEPEFLAYLLRAEPGRRLLASAAQGATRYNLSKRQFLQLQVTMPPINEQQAIASVLRNLDQDTSSLAARLAKVRDIKRGMMQDLLTGRTRLPAEVTS